jgi:uncharacterized protein involved in response to NO
MTSTAEQMRRWAGPAILSYGFRPFFLGAGLWAVISMTLWLLLLAGVVTLPTVFDPISWHAHEFLFGYLGAVIAGFLLTAVPNWTGRLPIVGWRLGALAGLWILGRIVIAASATLPMGIVAAADMAFLLVLAFVIAREIVAGKNWRNLVVLGMLALFILGNGLFHLEAARDGNPANGTGLRIALAAGILMIAVIGGRIVPSFTRNWLVKQGNTRLPAAPMQRFDRIALVALFGALVLWVGSPDHGLTGAVLVLAGLMHFMRLARWSGHLTKDEPLVLVLHLGYGFVPLGALAVGIEIMAPGTFGMAGALHLWMAGAIGLMTLAVMTRATLGHTGQALTAGHGTVAIYGAFLIAVMARVAAGAWPEQASVLHHAAGLGWLVAFGGFVLIYGRLLWCKVAAKKL